MQYLVLYAASNNLITSEQMYSLVFLSSLETTHSELLVQCTHQIMCADLNNQFSM